MNNLVRKDFFIMAGLVIIASIIGSFTTPYMGAASFSYFLLCFGLTFRKTNKNIHARLMGCAIVIDIALVLILETQRSAINTFVSFSLETMQIGHIVASTLATVLYIPVAILGYKLLTGTSTTAKARLWHIRLGVSAYVLRTIGFFLMFSLLTHVTK